MHNTRRAEHDREGWKAGARTRTRPTWQAPSTAIAPRARACARPARSAAERPRTQGDGEEAGVLPAPRERVDHVGDAGSSRRFRGSGRSTPSGAAGLPRRPAIAAAASTPVNAWRARRVRPRAGWTASGRSARAPTEASSGPATKSRPARASRQQIASQATATRHRSRPPPGPRSRAGTPARTARSRDRDAASEASLRPPPAPARSTSPGVQNGSSVAESTTVTAARAAGTSCRSSGSVSVAALVAVVACRGLSAARPIAAGRGESRAQLPCEPLAPRAGARDRS